MSTRKLEMTETAKFEVCEDGHRCENGSICVENPYNEGKFYCDCDEVIFDDKYEGLSCEHIATQYCSMDKLISKNSFCTNEGQCIAHGDAEEAHWVCECPSGYEGNHCQFVKGSKPDGWPFKKGNSAINSLKPSPKSSSDGGMKGGIVALIVIICCAFVIGMGYIIYKKKVKSDQPIESADEPENPFELPETVNPFESSETARIPSKDLVLDADGSGIKEDIENKQKENRQDSSETTKDTHVIMDDAEII